MANEELLALRRDVGLTDTKRYIFLMSGDAWAGAMQAGALAALATLQTFPVHIVASGFGAINAVIAAGNPPSVWRRKLMAFWMSGPWLEWVTHGLARSKLGVATDAFKARLSGAVDWKRLNAGAVRCQLILPDSDGGYRTVDTAQGQISPDDVLESARMTLLESSNFKVAPEEAAFNEISGFLKRGWVGIEIGMPPVAPSPPNDPSRLERRLWIERWYARGRHASDGTFERIPWNADRRRPSRRAYRPYALFSSGERAVFGPVEQYRSIAQDYDDGEFVRLPVYQDTISRLGMTGNSDSIDLGIQKIDRLVGLLYKTVRKPVVTSTKLDYSGERDSAHYGAAEVTIPEGRKIGSIKRPFKVNIWGFEFEMKESKDKHFTLKAVTEMGHEDWLNVIKGASSTDALVFVHGFNVAFQDAVFRFAQIIWDLGYSGLPVLYSWASRGSMIDYPYDRNSALIGRKPFLDLLGDLAKQGITRVHILAHSMGNFLVLDALSTHAPPQPLGIEELVMAAPDIDVDQYKLVAPMVRKLTKGMTLYASSVDKALAISRTLAGKIPRAGDVFDGKPVLVGKVDTIDASAIGAEIMGLNHSHYATDRSILNDVKRLLADGKRPPPERGVGLDAVPNDLSPAWWRFAV